MYVDDILIILCCNVCVQPIVLRTYLLTYLLHVHCRHTTARNALATDDNFVLRYRVRIRQIRNRATAVVRHLATVPAVPRWASERGARVRVHDRRLGRLQSTRDRCADHVCRCFGHHRPALVRFLARSAAVLVARQLAIRLHQLIGVVCQKHTHLVTIVNLVVLLDQVIHVALGAVVSEVATVCHTRGAFEELVVTCRIASILRGVCRSGCHSNQK